MLDNHNGTSNSYICKIKTSSFCSIKWNITYCSSYRYFDLFPSHNYPSFQVSVPWASTTSHGFKYLFSYQCFLLGIWCTLYITCPSLISDFGTCQWCSSKSGHNDRTTRHRKSNSSSCFALHHRTVLRCDCRIRCTAGKLLIS